MPKLVLNNRNLHKIHLRNIDVIRQTGTYERGVTLEARKAAAEIREELKS